MPVIEVFVGIIIHPCNLLFLQVTCRFPGATWRYHGCFSLDLEVWKACLACRIWIPATVSPFGSCTTDLFISGGVPSIVEYEFASIPMAARPIWARPQLLRTRWPSGLNRSHHLKYGWTNIDYHDWYVLVHYSPMIERGANHYMNHDELIPINHHQLRYGR